jgi:hypothetical protein
MLPCIPITILPSGLSWPFVGWNLPILHIISVCFDVYFTFVKIFYINSVQATSYLDNITQICVVVVVDLQEYFLFNLVLYHYQAFF